MNLLLTGLNYKTAPVAIREKIALRPHDIPSAFQVLNSFPEIRESAILSTCNRTEIYVVTSSIELNGLLPECLGRFCKISPQTFSTHLYTKHNLEVARHLFTVASGLDSLVLGEDQILSQVKQFFKLAQETKSLGTILYRLFQAAIEAGKRIRHETAIGENPGSVGEAALELARQIFGQLNGKNILVLGTGKMGRLLLDTLLQSGVSKLMVCSRTFEKAQEIAKQMNGTPFPIEDLAKPLLQADIVLSASSSSTPLLTRAMLDPIMRERRFSPLFIVDIAVPRNVEESAGQLENLFLYNIDDLKQIVQKANMALQKEMAKAEKILEEELQKFNAWKDSLQVVPTLRALTNKMEEVKSKEIERILSKFPGFNERQRDILENLAHGLVNKMLHGPLIQLKKYANHPLGEDYLKVVRDLFGLEQSND